MRTTEFDHYAGAQLCSRSWGFWAQWDSEEFTCLLETIGPVLKATLVFTSMLILFGVAVLGVSCFGTVPGSEAFDSGMTLSRTLFQISAVLNMVMLFVIQARLRREKKM